MEGYCVRCKMKREIQDPEATFTSSGAPATKGKCPVCGSGMFRMGRTDAHANLDAPTSPPRRKRKRKAGERKGRLVIVESPAKARTIHRFLGNDYRVRASVGHVRDLLRSKLSVDIDNDFEPRYRVPNEKREVVKELKAEAAKAAEVYLATDPDREGEAIAWHLLQAAEIDDERARRVVFHEITQEAVEHAFAAPRNIDMRLVNAQQARRILDRLVGYNLSPLLWAKVRGRLSAGRVQSAALRLVVDREREIQNFVSEEYWSLDGEFLQADNPPPFRALLVRIGGRKPELKSESEVQSTMERLRQADYEVSSVRRGTRLRKPSAPFTTSTLQQDASRRLRFSTRKTMAIAQQLYEGIELGEGQPTGLITYMRTDSVQVSGKAQAEAREVIASEFGEEFLPKSPPAYKTKSRRAQEAHEAVRPTSVARIPASIKAHLSRDQFRLYSLIWSRFIASQMRPAEYDTLKIEVEGRTADEQYTFRLSASALRFPGFLKVYSDPKKENDDERRPEQQLEELPDPEEGKPVQLLDLFPEQHFTKPPPRYSEASLVRTLEEHGIGRPSTYAPIITTIQQRGYVERRDRRLHPTEIGEVVNDLLVEFFPEIVDLGFTARMEAKLDDIADGEQEWVEVVRRFYEPFEEELQHASEEMPEMKAGPEELGKDCPECGNPLLIRHGRYGRFIGCSDFPNCRYTEPWLERIGVTCPEDGGKVVERRTRKGRIFYGCSNYPDCEFTSWKRPIPHACPNCAGLLVLDNRKEVLCIQCENRFEAEPYLALEPDLAQ